MILERAFEGGDRLPENPVERGATTEEIIAKLEERLDSLVIEAENAKKLLSANLASFETMMEASVKGEMNPQEAVRKIEGLKKEATESQEAIDSLEGEIVRVRALLTRMKEIKGGREDELLEIKEGQNN